MELVDKQANVIFLDAAAETDGNAGEALGLIFLDQVLDFGNVALAVRALGAKIVDQKRLVCELAEQNSRIANARKWLRKIHLHGLVSGGILHQLHIGHLGFRSKLRKRRNRCNGGNT